MKIEKNMALVDRICLICRYLFHLDIQTGYCSERTAF